MAENDFGLAPYVGLDLGILRQGVRAGLEKNGVYAFAEASKNTNAARCTQDGFTKSCLPYGAGGGSAYGVGFGYVHRTTSGIGWFGEGALQQTARGIGVTVGGGLSLAVRHGELRLALERIDNPEIKEQYRAAGVKDDSYSLHPKVSLVLPLGK